ncbi:hypothetical protein MLD38_010676 [Melastoma candidum]|uniref:Uncharacterized protein n=1 Tax=Melastoma candidum TaxID=119954 RepID=A0ACB9R2F3_9MYRT|nr:hypothetical protein MLD38_010676 [Melastoma candidum]
MGSSAFNRLMQRASSSSSIRSVVARTTSPASCPSSTCRINGAFSPLPNRSAAASVARRLFSSRSAAELGCVQSLLPLHSAVAAARLTSCLSTASMTCQALSQELGLSGPR